MRKLSLPAFAALACAWVVATGPARPDEKGPPAPGVVPFDAEAAGRLQDAWAKHLSTDRTVTNGVEMKLVLVPPGKFRMQGEDVTLTEPYYLGRTEVTQAQWTAVMGTTPWADKGEKGENRPATYVSWDDARAFCERLTAKEKKGTYRLPTEAEWEFACRAGTATKYSFGDDESKLVDYAWCGTNAKRAGEKYPHDVGLKKPNAFGLYDMHGNVSEYCAGEYGSDRTKEERPRPWKGGPQRVAAGGSWSADFSLDGKDGSAFYCRSEARWWPVPTVRDNANGFRVAWTPPADPKRAPKPEK